ncbi:?-D-glucose-1-phosphatase [Aquimixticola soesokkakensis]|uniref:?-D-glucose-1-phosphatase n=1 Tax=Aquimixticola soesokkakensis TaxID=1519096 RepID=A0A1Y5RJ74_9RHOB|nr:HAD family phosphatase [Aquimixticola soesokkakensis]SLN16112.1 ?-D-glucose-1-phosphatase [Aquimixticola soesokkakensis]
MSKSSVDAVIFDIGNVLIEWQPERHYDAVVGEARRREMFAAVDLHAMNDRVDQGGNWRETVMECARAYPEFASEIRMWYFDWMQMAAPAIPQSVALLRALRAKGVPVFALTNFGIENFEFAQTQYPFLTEFDRAFVSGRMGCVKPHRPIYEQVESACKIDPKRLLFADDRAENLDVPRSRGWQVHLFDGPTRWAERLVDAGLLTRQEAQL